MALRSVLRLSSLVSLEVARSAGRSLGRVAFRMNTHTVRVVRRNIELAYPERSCDQQEALVKEAVLEQGALTAELGHVWRRSSAYVMSKLRIVGIEHLEAAAAEERGVLVLAPHVGNWEVLPHHLVTQGDFLGLVEPPKLPSVGKVVLDARKRPGGAYVPTTPKGLVQLVRHFKRGGLTGILPDQVPAHESGGLNVPFKGIECFTASLCANLLSKSGARAVLAGVFRVKGGPPTTACLGLLERNLGGYCHLTHCQIRPPEAPYLSSSVFVQGGLSVLAQTVSRGLYCLVQPPHLMLRQIQKRWHLLLTFDRADLALFLCP